MKKRMIAIAAATMATMMMATPVLAEDYKIGICNYVDDASLNQIVDNLESRLAQKNSTSYVHEYRQQIIIV